ncbi:hypothetical protein [Deinococcus hopiensis]|uniref:Uncharacterized protein n=1 Tax=Deinococcus hopiensis KR-140 TaxID=695939 RepID=A0A1W1UQ41_9DEIO|nr:hypothetical protein [Deinococcus hopiensis]SMB83153.1 hypothetical protein SAMN00790413_04282 [Deinococcus hopiensis KR-140]
MHLSLNRSVLIHAAPASAVGYAPAGGKTLRGTSPTCGPVKTGTALGQR